MNRPSRIGPFTLEEQVGGPGGSVFRAVHVENKRVFAARVFPAPNFAHGGARNEFSEELAKLKKIQSPHVARCFGGGVENGWCYLVHEWRPGERLSDRLARRGKLSWEATLEILRKVAEGLGAAHQHEVAHGALSPEKILLGKDDAVTIVDFRWNRTANLFRPVDTPAAALRDARVRAPEQFRGVDPIPPRADLYALGCVAFECLAGHPPFSGATIEELTRAHLETPPPRVASEAFDCPVWVDALVGHLLEKPLSKRPHSAHHVLLQIDEARKRVTQGAGVATHALGGFSALKVGGGREEVKGLLGDKSRDDDDRRGDADPWWERPWAIALAFVAGVSVLGIAAVIALWPKSEEQLFARASKLMATDDPSAWRQAKDECLDQLVKRFPEGARRPEVDAMLDRITMHETEGRLKFLTKLGQDPPTEGAKQYAKALEYEQDGDRATALDHYHAIVELFDGTPAERPYVMLSKRRIAAIEAAGDVETDVGKVVEARLADAARLLADGKVVEGKSLLRKLIRLYGANAEFAESIKKAEELLDPKSAAAPKASPKTDDSVPDTATPDSR